MVAKHESRCLLKIPGALRFIENRHMFKGLAIEIQQAFVSRMMHVLNECLHGRLRASHFLLF